MFWREYNKSFGLCTYLKEAAAKRALLLGGASECFSLAALRIGAFLLRYGAKCSYARFLNQSTMFEVHMK